MSHRQLIALTPAGAPAASLAVAACRAGARGTLDLEFAADAALAEAELRRLDRHAQGAWGVLLAPESPAVPADLSPAWVVLTDDFADVLAVTVEAWRGRGAEVLAECRTAESAARAAGLGVDGVVLKGHESGGFVGPDPSFILIQKWKQLSLPTPFWVRGGAGPNTAAACRAAGAEGVVLDSQLLLARESDASDELRARVAGMDGGETAVLGDRLGLPVRVYARPDSPKSLELANEEAKLLGSELPDAEKQAAWRRHVRANVAADPARGLWPVGQDVALAAGLAGPRVTAAGILQLVAERSAEQAKQARDLRPLAEGSPLAAAVGTRYPLFQGPMTRVSDVAPFADAVASGGGLPFLALALMRGPEIQKLLDTTKPLLGKKSWGVGLLGFVPPELRAEQMGVVKKAKPAYAIIAGGRPDQAAELEKLGTKTYLHVPSPGLLKMFLKDGARKFIFEGRECGGHVGPRTSFALWEGACAVLEEHLAKYPKDEIHAVFAGGVHDARSGAMLSALTAGLAAKGVKVGALLGTAYLFTEEAVRAGAITARFQEEAVKCGDTALLETGPGHAIRVVRTPYADDFHAEKKRLTSEGKSHQDVALALERMNLGRLRAASKGVDRLPGSTELSELTAEDQYRRGMYMIGQVAGLRHGVTTVEKLHADVCGSLTAAAAPELLPAAPKEEAPPPCDVAVIGMACFYPGAGGLQQYWQNILGKKNAVIEIPETHWDWRPYYDPDPRARDKMVSKWGGFMSDVVFDPLRFGITPKSIPNIEPLQLLLLEAVRQAFEDAGYANRPFERERAAAILGVGGGGMPLSVSYGFRACMPLLDSIPGVPVRSEEIVELGQGMLPEWTEDSFPGILLNVAAGRVANRFNLGGPNMAIDAACGSSLAALYAGVRELTNRTSDLAVVMGADCVQTPYAYVAFSKTHALSPKGRCRPFDAAADGIALAEGIGVSIIKRLEDAERDGDTIYAVIKGIGASSDGRDKGLTAPRAEGQLRALHRAYAQARVSPASVGLVEAHGTGTVVGDRTEATAIGQLFREGGGAARSCALGSVKSMIGHSKCAAGLAGLIKAAFALHHKVLPPTLAETPNPQANLDGGPLYLNTEPRPWVHGGADPRRAGVSAFGFGGTNFHAVLEEYRGDYLSRPSCGMREWPAELFAFRRNDASALTNAVKACRDAIAAGAAPALADLAAGCWNSSRGAANRPTLTVVAATLPELRERLDAALKLIDAGKAASDPRGVYYSPAPAGGKVAFLFPGQGSQYPDMLAQLALTFPEVREVFDAADAALDGKLDRPLSRLVFPPSPFTPADEADNAKQLQRTDVAQPALGAASLAAARLLHELGVAADFAAGHSYGEYAALAYAGALPADAALELSHRRGQLIRDAAGPDAGGMVAVDADADAVSKVFAGLKDVWPANLNGPNQTVVAGTEAGLTAAMEACQAAKLRARRIPVACGFHSPLVAGAAGPLADAIRSAPWAAPRVPVWSNATAAAHPSDPAKLADAMAGHLTSPVRFRDEIESLHAAGVTVYVEVGPGSVLTGLASQTLAGRPVLTASFDAKGRPGLAQLMHLLGQLLAAGAPARLDRLYRGRGVLPVDPARMTADTGKPKHAATAWVVNGVRSRPVNGPEPRLLGQPLPKDANPAAPPKPKPAPAAEKPAPGPLPAPPKAPVSAPVLERASMSLPAPLNGHHANGHAHPAPASRPAAPSGDAAQVMARFQDVMAKFLDTQKSVMLGYLGAAPAAPATHAPAPALPYTNGHANGNGHAYATPPAPTPAVPAPIAQRISAPPAANVPAEVPAAKPAPTPEPAAPAGVPTRDELLAQLLDLVSERTGYPKEALSVDLDLEADLGIDSIKRVEILGTLAEGLSLGAEGGPSLEMEKLSGLKTLRGIADYVAEVLAGGDSEEEALADEAAEEAEITGKPADLHPTAAAMASSGVRQGEVQRLVVRLIPAPLPARPKLAAPPGVVVLTDDGQGVARELGVRLADLDVSSVTLSHGPGADDLTDPAAVAARLTAVRAKHGPVGGLIHLLPLAEPPAGETDEARAAREVKSLYLLARTAEADLRAAGPGAVLLAATGLGGTMGYGPDAADDMPATHGGVAGFTKCLGYEWPEVTVRAVDLEPEAAPDSLAESLLAELGDPAGPFEVGVRKGARSTWQCDPGPLNTSTEPNVSVTSDDVVLVTGGARGITAKVALELAKRHKPTLVLVGSSAEPAEEGPDTAVLTTAQEIKGALLKKAGTPAAAETAYRRLVKDREILANLAAIRAAGSRVDYRACDVRDGAAVEALVKELGNVTVAIHGAGVIEDKLVKDKTPESWDRVFGTKVNGAFALARALNPKTTKALVLFSSVASRYGNKGQADYAAANEVLSKLACGLDRRWPGRACALAWGPWGEVGMVAELEKHLVAKGLKLIEPAVGAKFAADELLFGAKGEPEVVVAGGTERPAAKSAPPAAKAKPVVAR